MQVTVEFQDDRITIDLPGEALLASWSGPAGSGVSGTRESARKAFEEPLAYPPVRQLVVPGDTVAIALDGTLPSADLILQVLIQTLQEAGVNASDVTVVRTGGTRTGKAEAEAGEAELLIQDHDAADRTHQAYLSSTKEGRRIYLSRAITDADVVIPVGRLGHDPILGYCGPWSVLFPGMSDEETRASYRRHLRPDPPDRVSPVPWLDEVLEVSWLLGSAFQVGVVPGETGAVRVIAGLAEKVRDAGIAAVDECLTFQAPSTAECVMVGIGAPGTQAGIPELVNGLVTASRLVNHGGKIVAVSRVQGPLGPSLQRLTGARNARDAAQAVQGHDEDADSVEGRRLAQVLEWADVYLHSALDRQGVEDLFMVPLDHPEDVRRLVARAGSCIAVSRADRTRATVRGGGEA